MILVGNQRGGAKDLALHLLKPENDHVEVHDIRGFASNNLMSALNEVYAISHGTRCRQYLFSLSLNPPPNANVATSSFEQAIQRVESELGLMGQPRAIVFHEKDGRRHAHVVWSRIKIDEMKAIQLSFTHKKLQQVSRSLYLEHGWKMPRGLTDSQASDPNNFTLAEWQQAKRNAKDPRAIKAAFQDAWAISDSKNAFCHTLKERGYRIARGDKRGFVAVDIHGEVYAIAKWVGVKTNEVRERLGDESVLPAVAEAKARITEEIAAIADRLKTKQELEAQKQAAKFEKQRKKLIGLQRDERQELQSRLAKRKAEESITRQSRYKTGLKGVWDRLRGEYKRIQKLNEKEKTLANDRDRREQDLLIFHQLQQRKRLNNVRYVDIPKTENLYRRNNSKEHLLHSYLKKLSRVR